MNKHLHAIVRGRVQMVGYRYFVAEQAQALSLTGWVRNGDVGATVEVVAEGEETSLRELEATLRRGPSHALVDGVDVDWSDALEGFSDFQVRF